MAWKCFLFLLVVTSVYNQAKVYGRQNHSSVLRFISNGETDTQNLNSFLTRQKFGSVMEGFGGKLETLRSRKKKTGEDEHSNATEATGATVFEKREHHTDVGDTMSISGNSPISNDQSFLDGLEDAIETVDTLSPLSIAEPVWEALKLTGQFSNENVLKRKYSGASNHQPVDFFRCDSCLCFRSSEDQMVYAICRKKKTEKVSLGGIPQDLPLDTVYIDMDGNRIKHFRMSALASYKSLLTVKAPRNEIIDITAKNCSSPIRLQNLDLSYNNISNLEDGVLSCLPDLTHLNLRWNRITDLRPGSLAGLTKLKTLDLAYNELFQLHAGAFLHSPGLKRLDLSFNLHLSVSNKHSEIFEPLTALEVFNIQGCISTGIYPTEVLLQLPALRQLSVNGEKHPFDSRLSQLKNFTKLVIGTNKHRHHNCWTSNFTSSYFGGLVHLESVKIHGCRAIEFSNLMFHNNTRIVYFEFSYGVTLPNTLFDILCYLPQNNIRYIDISKNINEPFCGPLIVLTSREVKCLSKMKNLVSLNMDKNSISQVSMSFTMGLPASLEKLSLRGNLLTASQSLLIQVLQLPGSFPNLKELYENAQGVQSLKAPTQNLWRDSSHLAKWDRSEKFAGSNTSSVRYGYGFRHLYIYEASRTVNIGLDVFKRKKLQVDVIDFSNTFISKWGDSPVGHVPEKTLVANLSYNKCAYFRNSFFKANNSLVKLYAESNFLGPLLSRDIHGSKLSRLRNLEYLDLSRNHLFALPWRLFQGIPSLRILKLRSNDINHIDIHIAHMTHLIFLDLAKNSISSISERTRNELDYLAANGNISIDLTYNPLPCTCDGLELLSWMSTTRVRILYKDFLVCENSNKGRELLGDVSTRLENLHSDCISKILLILACSFSLAVLMLLTGFVWVFQKRWWIVYMRNLAISHFFGHRKARNRSTSPYTFDAFFVYSDSGCDFVLDECLEELEENRGHRLCVEDRDFLAGSYVPCNITSAVRSSRTTLVVLDEHFRAEGWVQYAVEMAQVEAVRSKRDVLHLLFMGSPPDGCLPGAYLKVLRQGRFSEVPPRGCSPDVREKFWDRLSQLIGHTELRRNRPHPRLEVTD